MEECTVTITNESISSTLKNRLGRCPDPKLLDFAVVLLPNPESNKKTGQVYPSGTREFFRVLSGEIGAEFTIDVASSEEHYQEYSEHSEVWFLPAILICDPAARDIVIGLVSNYVYERSKSLLPGRTVDVRSELLIQRGESMVSIKYSGPPGTFESIVAESLKKALKK